jgi:outer membrane protein OmpA-like peptidoglycan-associated protein
MFIEGTTILAVIFGLALMTNFACTTPHVQTVDCSVQEIIQINEVIMFDWDDYCIRADQMDLLNRIAAIMIANPDLVLVLEGYASEEGDIEYNLELSQERANAVKSMLILSRVPEENIKEAIGNGESTIFGDLLDANRRVMILSIN